MILERKRAVVAGIGPGLGRDIAMTFAREGADLVLLARNAASIDPVRAEVEATGRRVVAALCDVTDRADCKTLVAKAHAELGGIDVLVYNAYSAGEVASFTDTDLADWHDQMEVNLFGGLELCHAALPALREAKGSIVFINSRQIRALGQSRGGYAISKGALLYAARVLASELGPSGVRVNTVVPGWMWGPAVEQWFKRIEAEQGTSVADQRAAVASQFALRYMPTTSDVAEAVAFLASDRARAITGQALDVNAGETFD